jgi:hypothetical protein
MPRRTRLLAVALVGLAFGIRLFHLTSQSLWPDEAYSVVVSHWPVARLVSDLRADNVPLYTLLLGGWQAVAGESEFSLRFFSVLCAIPTIPLVYVVGKRLLGAGLALVAAALLAVSPWHVYYSQEVRMYALVGTLGLLASWAYLCCRWPSGRMRIWEGLLLGALAWTHLAGLLLILPQATVAIVRNVKLAQRWFAAWAIGIALILPWIVVRFHVFTVLAGSAAGHVSPDVGALLSSLVLDLVIGSHGQLDPNASADAVVLRTLTAIGLVFVLLAALALVPARRGRGSRGLWVIAAHALLPIAMLVVLVMFVEGFATRYAFIAGVWLPLLVVAGAWRLPIAVRVCLLTALVGVQIWLVALDTSHPRFERLDFRGVVRTIAAERASGDVVSVTPDALATYTYYADALDLHLPLVISPRSVPAGPGDVSDLAAEISNSRRLWRIRWQDYYYDPRDRESEWLKRNAIRSDVWHVGPALDLELWLVQPPLLDRLPLVAVSDEKALGDRLRLVGHQARARGSDRVTLTLYWQLTAPMAADYTVFVHLMDGNGHFIGQADGLPYDGQYPTTAWPVGPIISDPHTFTETGETVQQEATLETGFYLLTTMQRLGSPGQDAVRTTIALPLTSERPTSLPLGWLPSPMRLDWLAGGSSSLPVP